MLILSKRSKSIIFSFAILIGFLLPHSNIVFQSIQSLTPIILSFIFYKKNIKFLNFWIIFSIIFILALSFSYNIILNETIGVKEVFRFFSILVLFLLFPYIPDIDIPIPLLYIIILIIFLSQIAYVLNLQVLIFIFDAIYPYEGDVVSFSSEFLLQSSNNSDLIVHRRYGGLFHNPNQAVKYVTLLLAVFLIENKNSSFGRILPFLILIFISLLLSGSRTGLIVGLLLVFLYKIYLNKQINKINTFILLAVFFALFIYLIYNFFGTSDVRIFDIKDGIENSVLIKISWFLQFFNQLDSIPKYLIGHFSSNSIEKLYGIPLLDSEWGELFYCLGIFGFISFTLFYFHCYKIGNKNLKFYLIILLWGITSTIIFSFRMSFLFLLFLSNYYNKSIKLK